MSLIPEALNSIIARIDRHHSDQQYNEPPRPHFGASMAGHPCDRWKWFQFRWAVQAPFEGRILRLFRRGHNEEYTVVNDLIAAGCDVRHSVVQGEQRRVSFGSHVSGSMDGIIYSGVPEAPNKKHLLEIKTHNDKSFKHLMNHGVEKSKPEHWAQMQMYMRGEGLDRALYVAVNKNDDNMYTERVRLDAEAADLIIEHSKSIALSQRMPEPLSADATYYRCKWCPAHANCHENVPIHQKNCRTCANAEPLENNTWHCHHWDAEIPGDAQYAGCDEWVLHDDMRMGDFY